jgi:hypothetical protein
VDLTSARFLYNIVIQRTKDVAIVLKIFAILT